MSSITYRKYFSSSSPLSSDYTHNAGMEVNSLLNTIGQNADCTSSSKTACGYYAMSPGWGSEGLKLQDTN